MKINKISLYMINIFFLTRAMIRLNSWGLRGRGPEGLLGTRTLLSYVFCECKILQQHKKNPNLIVQNLFERLNNNFVRIRKFFSKIIKTTKEVFRIKHMEGEGGSLFKYIC